MINNNNNMLDISTHHNPLGLFIDTNLHHHGLIHQNSQYHQAMLAQQLAHQFGHHQNIMQLSPPKQEMFSTGGQTHQKSGKKSRADYINALCTICNAPADGLHYGAISCRSCNAFFRRAVTFKQTFICQKGAQCDVDVNVRCACRACRLAKCKAAGMRESDVQPKRDPTGSQKNRRAPQRKQGTQMNGGSGLLMVKKEPNEHIVENSPTSLSNSVKSEKAAAAYLTYMGPIGEAAGSNPYQTLISPSSISFPPSAESGIFEESTGCVQFLKTIKREEEPIGEGEDEEQEGDEEEKEEEGEEEHNSQMQSSSSKAVTLRSAGAKDAEEQAQFVRLVKDYGEHLLWMNRSLTPIKDFLSEEFGSCSKWRMMEPKDVEPLNKVELGGLMYWIDKLWPFRLLEPKEREVLFKRYSIRKISLDHFYTASKHGELLEKGHFAMPNNTYVPPDRTGFETLMDDEHTREAKFQILRPTIDRIWHSIVLPFANLKITDAEIVAIQLLQMWSPSNNRLLSEKTRQMMVTRRDWTIKRLYRHLQDSGHPEPSVRLGEILLFMPELEVIYDMHSKDFQVAQLFEFCNMSDYWYESYYYTNLNIA